MWILPPFRTAAITRKSADYSCTRTGMFRRYDQIAPFGVDALFVAGALVDIDALLAAAEPGRSLYQY
jgi:hypothetical protein